MIIIGHRGIIFRWKAVEAVKAGDSAVFIFLCSGQKFIAAKYNSRQETEFAVALLYNAARNDQNTFAFPHKYDIGEMLETAKQHKDTLIKLEQPWSKNSSCICE